MDTHPDLPTTARQFVPARGRDKVRGRKVILLVGVAAIVLAGLGVFGIRTQRLNEHAAAPMLGTWQDERGNLMQFRPDGTARYRFPLDNDVGYFEWKLLPSGQFEFYQFANPTSAGAILARSLKATVGIQPTDIFQSLEVDGDTLTLTSTEGEVLTYAKASDPALERAP